jgi:hypothetical protein
MGNNVEQRRVQINQRSGSDIPLEELDPWLAESLALERQRQDEARSIQNGPADGDLVAELRQEREDLRGILNDAVFTATGASREAQQQPLEERLDHLLLLLSRLFSSLFPSLQTADSCPSSCDAACCRGRIAFVELRLERTTS